MYSHFFTWLICIVCSVLATDEGRPCFSPNNTEGECIRFRKCKSLVEMIQKSPLNDDDIAFLRASQCDYNGEPLVCCTDMNIGTTTETTAQTTENNEKPSETTDERDDFTVISPLLPPAEMCRVRRTKGIVGGEKTRLDEYPWLVLLEYTKPGNTTGFYCGGALINERYILTAAHCLASTKMKQTKYKLKSVRLGEYQISTEKDCIEDNCSDPSIDVTVEQQIVHELYRPASAQQEHDIALLRLSRPVKYTTYIKPLCLPGSNRLRSLTFEDAYMDVAGWGMTENSTSSDFKLKVTIPGVPLDGCIETYRKTYRTTIGPNQFCAGGMDGKDSCRGDSGGSLVFIDRHHPTYLYTYCAGVVSFGPKKCGINGIPGVYTRVTVYIDWIVKNMRE